MCGADFVVLNGLWRWSSELVGYLSVVCECKMGREDPQEYLWRRVVAAALSKNEDRSAVVYICQVYTVYQSRPQEARGPTSDGQE
ncbi:hypothetical protein PHLCEN_2v4979 [Hermanssonia centrifuga]|uniref:Uncharacterized protein n=2 Tax=Hermanssonia centrifuga TaxID=98765 RepID=A0A2R6PC08_9APHY|nr:hypothetical protein PHLCEN_2v4979 [Hermanssonia centrifuga]